MAKRNISKKTSTNKSTKTVRLKKEDFAALLKLAFTGDLGKVVRRAIRKHKLSKVQAERLIQESFYTIMMEFEKELKGFADMNQFEDLNITIVGAKKFADD